MSFGCALHIAPDWNYDRATTNYPNQNRFAQSALILHGTSNVFRKYNICQAPPLRAGRFIVRFIELAVVFSADGRYARR